MKDSELATRIEMSETLAIDEKVRALQGAGHRVFSFGAGQPDAPTPETACNAGIEAIHAGKTKYTSPGGTKELREAIARKLLRENALTYSPDEILVTAGAKQAIFMALAVRVDPGDEVLLPGPYWVSYPSQIRMLGGVPRVLPTDETTGFKVLPEQIRAAIGPKTRGIILNSPSNPTGSVYTPDELKALMSEIVARDLWVISDEIYERIVYGDSVAMSPAALGSEVRGRTAVVNGVSKSYSMTGWRIGYFAAPRPWVEKAIAVQSHLCGNPCSISQEAALRALDEAGDAVTAMVATFRRRRDRVVTLIEAIPGWRLCAPDGAFYAFPDVSACFGKRAAKRTIDSDVSLAEYLIDEAKAAFVPGSGFGSARHLRVSFACADSVIEEGLGAVREAIGKLSSE